MAKESYDCAHCKGHGDYRRRNCKRYFPDAPWNKDYQWTPSHNTSKGHLVQINEIGSEDCPRSVLEEDDGLVFQLLSDFSENTRFEGASMYGPNLSDWPALLFDAFSVFTIEDNRIERAKMEIERLNQNAR